MADFFDYAEMQEVAKELIQFFAGDGTINATLIVKGDKGTLDLVTRTYSGGSPATEYPLICVKTQYDKNLIDGTLIKNDDIQLIVSIENLPITPTIDNKVKINGEIGIFSINTIDTISPTDSVIFYTFQCQK